jgi:hypothetical protein
VFSYSVLAATYVVTLLVGVKVLGLTVECLLRVLIEVCQCAGAAIVFLIINIGFGAVVVLLARSVGRFISLYAIANATFIVLAAVQGILFQLWWRRARG